MTDRHPVLQSPSPTEAERAVREARRLFQRALAGWVCDLLLVRRINGGRPWWQPMEYDGRCWDAA